MINVLLLKVQLELQQQLLQTKQILFSSSKTMTKIDLDKKIINIEKNKIQYNSKDLFPNCSSTNYKFFPKNKPIRFLSVLEIYCGEEIVKLILPNLVWESSKQKNINYLQDFDKIPKQNNLPTIKYLSWSKEYKEINTKSYTQLGHYGSKPIFRGGLWKKIKEQNPCTNENYLWGICLKDLSPYCLKEGLFCF